jgi:ElaB/YqjD/DUF883 family membrane-anchored ribosome-binding protein
MKTKSELEKFTNEELNTILKRVEEMLVIPIANVHNLNDEQLKEMKSQINKELENRK